MTTDTPFRDIRTAPVGAPERPRRPDRNAPHRPATDEHPLLAAHGGQITVDHLGTVPYRPAWELQDELAETENRINVARRDYNESVQTYNSYIRQFPQVITAKVTGAERREPFEAPEGANTAPQVEFD